MGKISPQAIAEARQYLFQIAATGSSKRYKLRQLLNKYLRLIPQDLGRKIDESQLSNTQQIQRQYEILNALEAAIAIDSTSKPVFDCAIALVPGSAIKGKKIFRQINQL